MNTEETTVVWADGFGRWHALASTAEAAAKAIRADLTERGDIGLYAPVTVEFVSAADLLNEYVEVW